MDDYTFLCKIHRHKIYNYDNASKLEQDALDRLIKDGRLSYEFDESQNIGYAKSHLWVKIIFTLKSKKTVNGYLQHGYQYYH